MNHVPSLISDRPIHWAGTGGKAVTISHQSNTAQIFGPVPLAAGIGSHCAPISPWLQPGVPAQHWGGKERRRSEFVAGRASAKSALRQVGWADPRSLPPENKAEDGYESALRFLPIQSDRSPQWPRGFVGSITHSRDWAWAVAGRADEFKSLGIDTEPVFEPGVWEPIRSEIGTAAEWSKLATLRLSDEERGTLLFSVKETYFKLWYPICRQFMEFLDVAVIDVCTHDLVGNDTDSSVTREQRLDDAEASDGERIFEIQVGLVEGPTSQPAVDLTFVAPTPVSVWGCLDQGSVWTAAWLRHSPNERELG